MSFAFWPRFTSGIARLRSFEEHESWNEKREGRKPVPEPLRIGFPGLGAPAGAASRPVSGFRCQFFRSRRPWRAPARFPGALRLPVFLLLLWAGAALTLPGQRITVFSEYQRPRPDGEVVAADRVAARREILSPALVRNGWVSLLFSVEAPPGENYTIYVAQNPDATAQADLYHLEYVDCGGEWIPDGLKPVEQPVQAVLSEGQRAQGYLLDLFLPASTPVERFRLEIQLHAGGRWTIYPMEMRPVETVAPAAPPLRGSLPSVEARADETVRSALHSALCSESLPPSVTLSNLRAVLLRNALQDLVIARQKSRGAARDVLPLLPLVGGWTSRENFCSASQPAPRGTEWWLRARGHLYQDLRLPELEGRR